jgi:phage gp16-like protein
VLRTKGPSKDLLPRVLHDLQEVCGKRATLPDSHMIPHQFSESTAEHCTTSKYAEVWKDQANLGEEGDGATDVCIKVIKTEKLHKVGESSSAWLLKSVASHLLGIPWGGCGVGEAG